ncbi:hypothetical protein [Streptomyces xinghaiensis]|uniref:hypothetical protein n=1 Tax=Streptomyces xinghaiensis TaxID=1038928 RepID=UPI002E0EDDD9|nr:hypothetical protein OG463_23545 [Streptomyces xinghaiensis]
MDPSEDEILTGEIAALGTAVGASGRLTGGVAKRLKKNVHEIDLAIPLPFDDAVKRVADVLGGAGRAVEPVRVEPGGDRWTIRVVVGAGVGGMNPVVVTALVTRDGEDGSAVGLRAAAKEGLIKQRAGEKTAVRLAALLSE